MLVGGVPENAQGGTRIRGESHMLLVGDPGTGKSQFLKYAAKLITRSVITSGIGSTSAGSLDSVLPLDRSSWGPQLHVPSLPLPHAPMRMNAEKARVVCRVGSL